MANAWLIRFRRKSKWDDAIWQRGPLGSWALRLPVFGWILRIERSPARWR